VAIAKQSRRVFLESKCCSNKSTYSYESPLAGFQIQLFFRSIFKLITISLRLSRADTLRTGDLLPRIRRELHSQHSDRGR